MRLMPTPSESRRGASGCSFLASAISATPAAFVDMCINPITNQRVRRIFAFGRHRTDQPPTPAEWRLHRTGTIDGNPRIFPEDAIRRPRDTFAGSLHRPLLQL